MFTNDPKPDYKAKYDALKVEVSDYVGQIERNTDVSNLHPLVQAMLQVSTPAAIHGAACSAATEGLRDILAKY